MIGFVGLSHLGIVSSVAAAAKGFDVVAYDPDSSRCERLGRGELPVVEPQLPELLASHQVRIQFTADPSALARCSVIVCAADVPTDADNRSDVSVIHQLIEAIARHAAPGTTLVVLSQVPPGFMRRLDEDLRGPDHHRRLQAWYQVETLIFGRAVERALNPERVIIGCRDPKEALPASYRDFLNAFHCPILTMRYESAELAKIAVNMFLVSAVSTTNTLAELCETLGADWSEIVPALQADRRIGPHAYLTPGLGIAGGNLERDLATVRELASRHGIEAGIVEAWCVNSSHRRDWVLNALHEEVLSAGHDPVIAIWGLAYKPQTHSTKNSPALHLLEALRSFRVQVYDPHATLPPSQSTQAMWVSSPLEVCRDADALAIMTAWPEFASIEPEAIRACMRGRLVVDPYGVLDGARCAAAGLSHRRLGTPVDYPGLAPC